MEFKFLRRNAGRGTTPAGAAIIISPLSYDLIGIGSGLLGFTVPAKATVASSDMTAINFRGILKTGLGLQVKVDYSRLRHIIR